MVYRIYVEKKPGNTAEADGIYSDLKNNLQISGLNGVRLLNRYDAEDISEETFEDVKRTIFSEPQTDDIYDVLPDVKGCRVFAVEYLPGQFDQRADSCAQCIQLVTLSNRPLIRSAKVYILSGEISDADFEKIKKYIINPVESREAAMEKPETIRISHPEPERVPVIKGFCDESDADSLVKRYGLAMDADDVRFCQDYFKNTEHRDPTMTELKLIDTYWSDHCRHTTFLTEIDSVKIDDETIRATYESYADVHNALYASRPRPVTLMDLATIGAKYLRKSGYLNDLDISEEINACSVRIKVDVDGKDEDWLLMFKNETHNHPTEIEPFGGAATCLGGAIRDPLSGRAYVYQAMRVTGAGDPTVPVSETLPGKLPQSKLTLGAASGYSSYGNQIGLATGGVYELYHPGYVAKRLEIGAVVGAVPERNVRRHEPMPGDIVILLGGKTGRDGCGGATGSSKAHDNSSLTSCGAEVQKGNPTEERKLQRLFRNPKASLMIKRCNDFGAGGVSVAVGELADGLEIDLNKVPKKYEGLDGTELAISESQERMAVVVEAGDAEEFIALAESENLEATPVAVVTEQKRMVMHWKGEVTVDLSREFLNSNGAPKHTDIYIPETKKADLFAGLSEKITDKDPKAAFSSLLSDLNVCSQKGLVERFDASIGAGTVVMPFGGKYQLTAPSYMAAKLPVLNADTDTVSVMAYGFNPYLSSLSPYHGAAWAVVESAAKVVASGLPYNDIRLTFQEYFGRTKNDPERWGKPFSALLGAYDAQIGLKLPSIGGKDSMSGTFENMDVPPTLVSFAITHGKAYELITPEFKKSDSYVYLIEPSRRDDGRPDYSSIKDVFDRVTALAHTPGVLSVDTVRFGGIAECVIKMCFGNRIGFTFADGYDLSSIMRLNYAAFIVESENRLEGMKLLGKTTDNDSVVFGTESYPLAEAIEAWSGRLENVFRTVPLKAKHGVTDKICSDIRPCSTAAKTHVRPKVIIPVFPGTNCEYDTAKQFNKAGAESEIVVLRNIRPDLLDDSINTLAEKISGAQIFMLPGGFSGGDEPDGSGKFITAVLRNPLVKEAVQRLLERNDGLILGICNGFQALIKSGLLPYGKIADVMPDNAPTLTFNDIARHQSMMVTTRIASVKSPWFSGFNVGDMHTIPISHGEGRFTAPDTVIKALIDAGQVATQYVNLEGIPTLEAPYNPNGSDCAIEGICSPDGRILGKMGHSERAGDMICKNVPGNNQLGIFASGVKYFS